MLRSRFDADNHKLPSLEGLGVGERGEGIVA